MIHAAILILMFVVSLALMWRGCNPTYAVLQGPTGVAIALGHLGIVALGGALFVYACAIAGVRL